VLDFLAKLFDTSGFPPRWQCGDWTAGHGWLHILSDLGVWSAYFAIPCILIYFVLRRRDVPFPWIFWLFGAFILACGTTHLMEAIIFWQPLYRLAGVIKLATAVVSWVTVAALVPVIPKALAMPTPEQLEREVAARKQAESSLQQSNGLLERQLEELRASEERFRLLVDGTRDHAIFMLDPTGRVISWNLGAERIKQYRAEDILGQHLSHFYPPEDIRDGKPEQAVRAAAATGRYEEEGWRVRKDGSRFWANVVITALCDQAGALRGFSKITRDMTERKQAEENARRLVEEASARRAAEERTAAVWEERERLRVTLTSIGDGVITTDSAGRVTFLNPVAEQLTGWSEQHGAYGAPLATVFTIVNEQSREPAEDPVGKVLREGRIVGLANHTVLIARDGTERPIADSAAPIRHQNGTLAGVVLVFRDASEQQRRDEEARKTREIFQLVHQIGKIGHWEWNSLTDENKWSPEIEALYGLPPGGFEGGYEGWAKLVHSDDLPRAEVDVRRAFQTGEYFTEFRVVWPDGSVHWLETRAHVFKDGHEKPVRIVGVNMDITDRKKQEEALRASEQRWRTLAEALPNLVFTDLPDGQCDWLSSQWGKRITSNKLELRKARLPLAAVIENAVETARPLLDAKGHTLVVDLPPEPVFLEADLTRLAQVFWNLLNNAAKYTDAGGRIELSAERVRREVVVTVRDSGIGIPKQALPGLFMLFSQVTPSLDRSQGGLGIGLALVKGLVEMHGGSVAAHSAGLGEGSQFVVRLPLALDQPPSEKPRPEHRRKPGARRRVLVVDDNRDAAASLATMLALVGHEARTAQDGLEALELAEAFRPEVILLDIGLPKLNGYDVCCRIREQSWGKRSFIVAITGWGQEDDRRRSREAGFDQHLVKPVDFTALETLLADVPAQPT
jgi:PAS domain S-box-containing protein